MTMTKKRVDPPIEACALDYADARRWYIFPAPPGEKKSHKAAEFSNGANWGKTRDSDEIKQDWQRWPNANIGVATGAESGIFVVEADTLEGHEIDGLAAMKALEEVHGPLPLTLMAQSPSGSQHYYFKWPQGVTIINSASNVAKGIDVRGEGGMVIAPPSVTDNGTYKWLNDAPLADAPGWLVALATKVDSGEPRVASNEPAASSTLMAVAVAAIPPCCDYHTWFQVGCALRNELGDDGWNLFDEWSSRCPEKYNRKTKTWKQWEVCNGYNYNAASIFYLADMAKPGWESQLMAQLGHSDEFDEWLKSQANDNAKGEAPKGQVKSKPPQRTLDIVCLADVQTKQIEWLWPGRIAKGKVTVVAGHPGIGKSMAGIDIAARISTGATWPCGEGIAPKGSVIILTTEDDAADTIKPRILAAGGDASKVHHIQGVKEADGQHSTFSLSDDLDLLEQKAKEIGDVAMIQIDPVNAYMGKSSKNFDSYRDTDIRALFEPIQAMATRLKIAIWVVTHFNKAGGDKAMLRFLGSIGMLAMARAAYAVIEDQDNSERRLMLPVKNNLGATNTGFAYTVREKPTGDESVPYCFAVEWEQEHATITADEAMAPKKKDDRRSEDVEKAKDIIFEMLSAACWRQADVEERCEQEGIPSRSIRSAKNKLGVISKQRREGWYWRLPGSEDDHNRSM